MGDVFITGDLRLNEESEDVPSSDNELTPATASGQADAAMVAAIMSGLVQPKRMVQQQAGVTCPLGNCTWDEFSTLGICHRCDDLTSSLQPVYEFGYYEDGYFNSTEYRQSAEGKAVTHYRDRLPTNGTAYALPNGHFLVNPDGCYMNELMVDGTCRLDGAPEKILVEEFQMTTYGMGTPNKTNTFRHIDTLIWSMSIIHPDEDGRQEQVRLHWDPADERQLYNETKHPWNFWPAAPVRATECAIYYCVKSIHSRVEGNMLHEDATEMEDFKRTPTSFKPTSSLDGIKPENVPDNFDSLEFHSRYSAINREDLNLTKSDEDDSPYIVAEQSVLSISAFFQDTLRTISWPPREPPKAIKARIPAIQDMFNGYQEGPRLSPNSLASIWTNNRSHIEDQFESLAISMTNNVRQKGGMLRRPHFKEYKPAPMVEYKEDRVSGKVGVPTTVYRVEWYWISLHGIIVIGSIIFCAVTMVSKQNIPVWKSHSLATMTQCSNETRPELAVDSIRELERRAESMEVCLSKE